MAHPILSAAVERALAAFDNMEASTGPLQNQAMQRLWAQIDAVRHDLRGTLEAVGTIQQEQRRLRQLDEECLREFSGVAEPENIIAVVRLLKFSGTSAFTDDALSKLVSLQADLRRTLGPLKN